MSIGTLVALTALQSSSSRPDLAGHGRPDRVAVLSRGHVVETGTHTEQMRAGGRYARLAGERRPGDAQLTR